MDNLPKEVRSKVMASIKGKNTLPEMTIRRRLWASGARYRVHDRQVYGIPDISSARSKVAVFIDGCFWHGCRKCYREPRSNVRFWQAKLIHNKQRRTNVKRRLKSTKWLVLEFWEHDVLEDPDSVVGRIRKFI